MNIITISNHGESFYLQSNIISLQQQHLLKVEPGGKPKYSCIDTCSNKSIKTKIYNFKKYL